MIMLKRKVKSKPRRRTNVAKVREALAGLGESDKFWKPKLGKNVIRILPSNREDGNIFYHSILHYGFKVEDQGRAFPCLGVFGKKCPVCQVIVHNQIDTDPDVKEVVKKISARHSYMLNILDRAKPDAGPRIYGAGVSVMKELYLIFNDDEYGDITDPEEGRDVKINRTGEGLSTRYSVQIRPVQSPIKYRNWEVELFDLEKEAYREIPSRKQYIELMQDNFGGILDVDGSLGISNVKRKFEDDDEEEEDYDDELPITKKKKKSKIIKPKKKRVRSVEDF